MGRFDPFGNELANFKAVHSVRKRAVDLVRTHIGDSGRQVVAAWGAELAKSGRTAKAEQALQFLVCLHCTLETEQPNEGCGSNAGGRFRRREIPVTIRVTSTQLQGNLKRLQ